MCLSGWCARLGSLRCLLLLSAFVKSTVIAVAWLCMAGAGRPAALSGGVPPAQHQISGSGRSRCVVRCAGISFERSRRQSAGIERLAGGGISRRAMAGQE